MPPRDYAKAAERATHIAVIAESRARTAMAKAQSKAVAAASGGMTAAVPYGQAYQSRVDNYWSLSLSMTGLREINRFNLRRMRDRARQLERENVLAQAILDRVCDNVIGRGLRLMPATPDDGFNKDVSALWENWKDRAELTGRYSFGQWQWMKYRSHLRDGDAGTLLVSRGDDAYLQSISGDYIDSIDGAVLDNVNHVHGMELNADGRPVQYHLKSADDKGSWQETIIPGKNMIFLARMKQLTDYRGEPLFAPIFGLLEQMDGYKEAEIIKKRIESCQALFIKRKAGLQSFAALPTTTNSQAQQQPVLNLEPGLVHYLQPDEDVAPFAPASTGQDFTTLMRCLAGFLGLNCGLTLNMLLLDYTGMSYTAGKMGSLQSHAHFRIQQDRFIDRVLKRVYQWRISKWVKAGVLTVPNSIVDSFWRHLWIPPAFPMLDPAKDISAQMAEMDSGLAAPSDEALSHGHVYEELCARIARDAATRKQYGIETSRSTLTRDLPPVPTGVAAGPGHSPSGPAPARPSAGDEADE